MHLEQIQQVVNVNSFVADKLPFVLKA